MKEFLLTFIPRFVTDRVALNYNDGIWSVVCLESQVEDDDLIIISAYGTIKTFTWLGFARGGKVELDKEYTK